MLGYRRLPPNKFSPVAPFGYRPAGRTSGPAQGNSGAWGPPTDRIEGFLKQALKTSVPAKSKAELGGDFQDARSRFAKRGAYAPNGKVEEFRCPKAVAHA